MKEQLELDFRPRIKCEMCEGAGWVWAHEIGDYDHQDQRYMCRECDGNGWVHEDDDDE